MCLWWTSRDSLETSLDPRFGSAAITAPNSGAYTDPTSTAPTNVATPPSPSQPLMAAISSISISPSPATKPVPLTLSRHASSKTSKSPRPSPSQSPRSARPPSPSTQFSTSPASPQPSPKWSSNPPPPSNGAPAGPTPVPVHQAYIPADQLSIGSKLSPGFTASSSATTPTTGGGWGSLQASPSNAADGSPTTAASGVSPLLKSTPQMQGQGVLQVQLPPVQQMPQQQQPAQGVQGAQATQQSRNRFTRIMLPTIKLGAAPKRQKKLEEAPESPEVEQWPGSM